MNETLKEILKRNAFQLVTTGFILLSSLFAAYISLQLFQQSTNFRVAAIQSDITDLKTAIQSAAGVSGKVELLDQKVDQIIKRQDAQRDKLDLIIQYQLEHK